ncbi:MAG: hypothetical protein CMN84_09230 [Spongiibacteraceae bacterium]|nr:hypothetical protein [Spongiibacteraceae bacterium]|tara:strand:- start:295 stop:1428 length:1134 start_codon:yes stop_codon:yes gene_type:complete
MYRSLQAGRAVAATLVLLFHLGSAIAAEKYFGIEWFSIPFSFGNSGVDFFFVLSGFIIYYVHKNDLGKPSSLKKYIYKRVVRIYPTYLIVFIGVYLLAITAPQLRNTVPHDIGLIIQSLLLIPLNRDVVGGTGAPVIIVAWTLQFEMMFYIAFALGILKKTAGSLLIALYLLGLGFNIGSIGFPLSFIFSEYIILFIMGMLVAQLVSHKPIMKQNPKYFATTGLLIYVLVAIDEVVNFQFFSAVQTMLYGVGCSFIVLALVSYERKGKAFLGHNFFQLLGSASYALYLIHYPLISILCKASMFAGLKSYGVVGALISYFIIFITCIIAAIAFHLFIEKPISEWLRKVLGKSNESISLGFTEKQALGSNPLKSGTRGS